MSRKSIAIAAATVVAICYSALSVYVISAGLRPQRGGCAPSGGPPPDIDAQPVELRSEADGIRLASWLVPATADRAVILVHGIDSDAWAGAQPDLARAYAHAGFQVLLFDLRANGTSQGDRITLGLLERGDILAAVDLLRARGTPRGRIGLHGTSYGAAMALLAAAEIPEIGAVIADSAFADVRDLMASEVARRVHLPGGAVDTLLRPGIAAAAQAVYGINFARLAPERAISAIAPRPLLLIHGEQDPVIPTEHVHRLQRRAGSNTDVWVLSGRGHTEGARLAPCYVEPSPGREAFLDRVMTFMDAALPPIGNPSRREP